MIWVYTVCLSITISKAAVQHGLRPACDLSVTEKNDNCREVAEVAARFYKGPSKVADQNQLPQSFEHAQKTSPD